MEVGEVLAALKRHLGAAGDDPPFEGLVAGSATMPVTGVATCAAPSLDVLRRAVADGCNLLLADGHPFFTYDAAWITKGATDAIAHAPVTMAKADYVRRAGLAVIRLPSAWARRCRRWGQCRSLPGWDLGWACRYRAVATSLSSAARLPVGCRKSCRRPGSCRSRRMCPSTRSPPGPGNERPAYRETRVRTGTRILGRAGAGRRAGQVDRRNGARRDRRDQDCVYGRASSGRRRRSTRSRSAIPIRSLPALPARSSRRST
jgi:hypothetical protein